jgi:hypothetical protein
LRAAVLAAERRWETKERNGKVEVYCCIKEANRSEEGLGRRGGEGEEEEEEERKEI